MRRNVEKSFHKKRGKIQSTYGREDDPNSPEKRPIRLRRISTSKTTPQDIIRKKGRKGSFSTEETMTGNDDRGREKKDGLEKVFGVNSDGI